MSLFRGTVFFLLSAGIALAWAVGCRGRADAADPPEAEVAASNTFLEAAAADLLGDGTPIVRLAEPGTCPGHFDIRPSQARRLGRCKLLLRMDFQDALDDRLSRARTRGLRVSEVAVPGGLCEPESYLSACRQTAEALVEAGLLERARADQRLTAIAARMRELSERCRQRVEPLRGRPVVASIRQQAFCRWLGLEVAATFRGADVEIPQRLRQAYDDGRAARAKLVIANRPEGRRAADFLAERLGGEVVVLGNFPDLGAGHERFDDLVEANLARLLEAAGP